MNVSSWGGLVSPRHNVKVLESPQHAAEVLHRDLPGIAYGMGRSYGDICLNPDGTLWLTSALNRFTSFDSSSGRLVCEAGVLLRDIQETFSPRGWMLPVTPGTQLVTIGGAIANDVHGKNHHYAGTLGHHIQGLRLARTDGQIIDCNVDQNPDWLAATIGGAGLTGVILSATLNLRPIKGPWIDTEIVPFENLADFFSLADQSEKFWEHTVAWIDCVTGGGRRGIFMRGNHSTSNDDVPAKMPSRSFPLTPPVSLVNRLTLRAFNEAYFRINQFAAGPHRQHYKPFFYPLDNLLHWNRMYGPKGFFQYQCVVPRSVGEDAIAAMLGEISKSKQGSFLAVLKTFGNKPSCGMLSFPKPGITLALDFPNRGKATELLFKRLDAIVAEADGRLYLAKDARMPKTMFERGYPRLAEFLRFRDPGISSAMSRRIFDR